MQLTCGIIHVHDNTLPCPQDDHFPDHIKFPEVIAKLTGYPLMFLDPSNRSGH